MRIRNLFMGGSHMHVDHDPPGGSGSVHQKTHEEARLCVLGPFAIRGLDGLLHAPTPMISALGTVLAAWPGRPVSVRDLVSRLWPGSESQASNSLQVYVSQLRKLIAPLDVAFSNDGYTLIAHPEQIDEGHFRRCARQAANDFVDGEFSRAVGIAEQALELWRGAPFQSVKDAVLVARQQELEELHAQTLEVHLSASLELAASPADINQVVASAQGHVSRYPMRESARRIHMHALWVAGRSAEAVASYEELAHDMQAIRGLTPSAATRRLRAQIVTESPDLIPSGVRQG